MQMQLRVRLGIVHSAAQHKWPLLQILTLLVVMYKFNAPGIS